MNPAAPFVIDTHTLYWHLTDPSKLSAVARQVFQEAGAGRAILVVPHIVLAELFWVFQKYGQSAQFAPTLAGLQATGLYRFEDNTLDDLRDLPNFSAVPEMHDRLIAILASRLGASIVTKDNSLLSSRIVRCIW
jgi:PIN domain nuclease of toxin-antitoxin system